MIDCDSGYTTKATVADRAAKFKCYLDCNKDVSLNGDMLTSVSYVLEFYTLQVSIYYLILEIVKEDPMRAFIVSNEINFDLQRILGILSTICVCQDLKI